MTESSALQHMILNSFAEELDFFFFPIELGLAHSFGRKRCGTSAKSEEEECFVQCWNLIDETDHCFYTLGPCADI